VVIRRRAVFLAAFPLAVTILPTAALVHTQGAAWAGLNKRQEAGDCAFRV